MISIKYAFFDDNIPNWHNRIEQVQYHVLVLVVNGRLTYQLNDQALTARKGDIVFIPAGTHREGYNDGQTTHQKYAVIFGCDDSLGLSLLAAKQPVVTRIRSFEFLRERFTFCIAIIWRNFRISM